MYTTFDMLHILQRPWRRYNITNYAPVSKPFIRITINENIYCHLCIIQINDANQENGVDHSYTNPSYDRYFDDIEELESKWRTEGTFLRYNGVLISIYEAVYILNIKSLA